MGFDSEQKIALQYVKGHTNLKNINSQCEFCFDRETIYNILC